MSQPIGSENDGMSEFPGFVLRQNLVDFCRSRVAEIGRNQEQLESVLDFSKFQNGKVSIEFGSDEGVLHEAYSANIGEQRAYRAICEWVANQSVPPSPVEFRVPDGELGQTALERSKAFEVVEHSPEIQANLELGIEYVKKHGQPHSQGGKNV